MLGGKSVAKPRHEYKERDYDDDDRYADDGVQPGVREFEATFQDDGRSAGDNGGKEDACPQPVRN